ncbi:MAG: M20/M25/M40 family metallo-hydrolase [bacterium]|nr:M20/M25/M40 family metallo-hydrolase [bacterium]
MTSRAVARGLLAIVLALPAAGLDMPVLIRELSSPAYQGRRAGEPGGALAAKRLEQELAALGLAPLAGFPDHSHYFSFREEARVQQARLGRLDAAGGVRDLPAATWQPMAASSSGFIHAPVLFCGFGIVAPELGWNDLQGATLAGKAVLIVRQVPDGLGDGSPAWREACRLERRLAAARAGGAAAVLVADSPFTERAELLRLGRLDAALDTGGPLLASLSASAADSLLAPAGQALRTLVSKASRSRKAQPPLAVPGLVELEIRQQAAERHSRNLGAAIPGNGRAADRWILLGAHYDHLGMGADGRTLHPGADDNASGTAMLLETARRLQASLAGKEGERRSLALVLFGGEELGRLGSRSLLRARPAWIDSLDLMVNLDMVGRLRDEALQVLGGGEHPELTPSLERAAAEAGLRALPCPEAPGGDHESFREADIPALMLFTGPHEDYHQPTDTADRLNLEGLEPVARTLAGWIPALLDPGLAVGRVAPTARKQPEGGAPIRVALGIVPGYESAGEGMTVQDVKAGSAAERAGLRPGDRIVALGRHPVANIHDYTFALRHFASGDEAQVALLREGRRLQLSIRLEERVR